MNNTIKAIYSKGVLKPDSKLNLPENQMLTLKVLNTDDVPASHISAIAADDSAYEFLKDEREDVYSAKDGKPV